MKSRTLEQIQKHDEKCLGKVKSQVHQALLMLPEDHPIVDELCKWYDELRNDIQRAQKGGINHV